MALRKGQIEGKRFLCPVKGCKTTLKNKDEVVTRHLRRRPGARPFWDAKTINALSADEEAAWRRGDHTLEFPQIELPVESSLDDSDLDSPPPPASMDFNSHSSSVEANNVTATADAEAFATGALVSASASNNTITFSSDDETLRAATPPHLTEAMGNAILQTDKGLKGPLVWHSGPSKISPEEQTNATRTISNDAPELPHLVAETITISSSAEASDASAAPATNKKRKVSEATIIGIDEEGDVDKDEVSDEVTDAAAILMAMSSSTDDDNDLDENDLYPWEVYDPAEKLPINQRKQHYFDLGKKMESYTEMRLKRIMENPKTSNEDYNEAEYQLHTRFPKHKQGRATWGA